jgi:AraC-like DNA-binding protein
MQAPIVHTAYKNKTSNDNASKPNVYPALQASTYIGYTAGSLFLEENLLLFVTEGMFTFRYGKEEYVLSKNQMVLLKKDILIEFRTGNPSEPQGKAVYIQAFLNYDLIREFTKLSNLYIAITDEPAPVSIKPLHPRLQQYVNSLEPYFSDGDQRVTGNLVKIKLLELLFCLSYTNDGILEQLLDVRTQFRSNITATVEENIMNSLSLNQLAVLAGRSLSSFRRDFLAIYNMPPSQWIRQKRLEKAQELLLNTNMSITDICYTLGFENIAHFSRLFKSQFSYPPSGFRMQTHVA